MPYQLLKEHFYGVNFLESINNVSPYKMLYPAAQ